MNVAYTVIYQSSCNNNNDNCGDKQAHRDHVQKCVTENCREVASVG